MSFITKALERAKALHHQKEKPSLSPRPEKEDLRFPPPLDIGLEAPLPPAAEITYTITRMVPVDKEAMRRNRLIVDKGDELAAEEYKLIRTHILQRTRGEGRNTLMVTGPLPGEGKTLTAINLAVSIAQEIGQTVLLVDLDLRFPSVTDFLGISARKGLVDHLKSGVPISELLVHPEGVGNIVILPAGRAVAEAAELISSPLMTNLVHELKHFYPDRYVLFDLPPVLYYADALAFAPLMDGIVLVVEAGRTTKEEIKRCVETLKGFPVLGFVLNKVEGPPVSYSYYNRYYRYQDQKHKDKDKKKFKIPWFK